MQGYLTIWMCKCEGKLNGKTAHFRLSSMAPKRRLLKLPDNKAWLSLRLGLYHLPGYLSASTGNLKDEFEFLENVFLTCWIPLGYVPTLQVSLAFEVNLCIAHKFEREWHKILNLGLFFFVYQDISGSECPVNVTYAQEKIIFLLVCVYMAVLMTNLVAWQPQQCWNKLVMSFYLTKYRKKINCSF